MLKFRIPILLRLALRNLLRHPQRSAATALGIALGVAAVLSTLSLGGAIQQGIRSALQGVTGQADHLIVASGAARALFDFEALALAPEFDALPILEQPIRYGSEGFRLQGIGNSDGLLLSGRILSDARSHLEPLVAGSWPAVGSGGVVISEDLQRRWGVELGAPLTVSTLLGTRDFVLQGVMAQGASSLVLINLADMQDALRLAGKVSQVAVYGAPPSTLPPQVILTEPSANGAYAVDGLIELLSNGLRLLAALLLLLSGLLAYNTFAISRLERQSELSLLRVLCLTAGQVQRLSRLEAIIVGIVGGVLGLLLSVVFSWLLLFGYGLLLNIPLLAGFRSSWHGWQLALALPLSLSIALLASGGQRQQASPLASRHQQQEEPSPPVWRYWLGVALLLVGGAAILLPLPAGAGAQIMLAIAASVVLMLALVLLSPLALALTLWLSRPLRQRHHLLRLSYDFSSRNRSRNAVALSTVALGISLILMVGSLVAGFDRTVVRWVSSSISGDVFMNAPLGVPEDFVQDAVATIPGLRELSPVGVATVRVENVGERGRNLAMILVEPYRFDPEGGFGNFWYLSDPVRGQQGLEAGELIVSSTFAQRFDLQVDDSLVLRTRNGRETIPIAGIMVDFTAGGDSVVTSYARAPALGIDSPRMLVGQVDGDAEAVMTQMRQRYAELSLDINNGQYYRRRVLATSRRIFAATYSLLLLALLLSALAVGNTLAMNLQRRQHDLASLRVLGIPRQALRRLVLIESLWVVLPAGLIGLLYGWLLSVLVGKSVAALSQFSIAVTLPWWLLALAFALSPLVAILAALGPARRASRLEPVVALQQLG